MMTMIGENVRTRSTVIHHGRQAVGPAASPYMRRRTDEQTCTNTGEPLTGRSLGPPIQRHDERRQSGQARHRQRPLRACTKTVTEVSQMTDRTGSRSVRLITDMAGAVDLISRRYSALRSATDRCCGNYASSEAAQAVGPHERQPAHRWTRRSASSVLLSSCCHRLTAAGGSRLAIGPLSEARRAICALDPK